MRHWRRIHSFTHHSDAIPLRDGIAWRKMLTCIFILISSALFAGINKDTIILGEVIKVETASTSVQSNESPLTDLKYKLGESLGDALGEYSSVYVKNYGTGELSSLAVRGTSATETEIQWNGIKLTSPTLGQEDLSLFTIGMQDELQLVSTGYHGTIGGTLKLDNKVKIDSGFTIDCMFRRASFGTYDGLANVQYATTRFFGATKVSYLSAENDFKYQDPFEPGNSYTVQTNAAVRQLSVLQQLGAKLNDHNQVEVFVWLSGAMRQIPPLMSEPVDQQSQDDYSIRIMADWKATIKKLKLKFTSAYLYDKLHYMDPNAQINDTSTTQAIRNVISASYLFPFNLAWNTELNYDHEQANVSEYGATKYRNTEGIRSYADYYLLDKFRFHGGFREDLIDNRFSAFAPELSFNYLGKFSALNHYSVGIIASRDFRVPTFNDLYWTPGGNPNLQEERSWDGEIQLKYSYRKIVEVSLSNFYIYVDNWIQWIPQGSLWTPVNFRRVFSRGAEATLHLTNADDRHPNQFTIHFNASCTYTKATNLDAAYQYDMSKGMQLIYVPYYNALAGLQLGYRKFYIRSVNTYTGSVFTSTDNSQSLKGYFLMSLEAGKDFLVKKTGFGCSFRVNNLTNLQYQSVADYAMPGRNYEVTVRFKFS